MKNRNALTILGLCAGIMPSYKEQAPKQIPPNIVCIMSDDHGYQAISAYGYGLNKTPNIDRLAREGAIFAPTFLDYAGIQVPADMQGKSFRKLVAGKTSRWRDAVYYTHYEHRGHGVNRHYRIATDRYKLIHFYSDIDEWELYDLQKDPNELQNAYNDPAYVNVRTDLHARLEELRKKYGDSDELNQKYMNQFK